MEIRFVHLWRRCRCCKLAGKLSAAKTAATAEAAARLLPLLAKPA